MSTYKLLPAFSIKSRDQSIDSAQLSRWLLVSLLLAVALFGAGFGSAYTSLIALHAVLVAVAAFRVAWSDYVLMTICLITSAWSIVEFVFGLPPLAWTGNINIVGYISAIGCMVLLSSRFRWLSIPCAISLLISNCAGAFLVLVAWAVWRFRRSWWPLPLAGLAIAVVIWNGVPTGRLVTMADIFTSRFQFFGSSGVVFTYHRDVWHCHNLLLQSLTVLGGIPTLCISSVACWFVALARLRSEVVAWLLVSSAVDFLYWWPGVLIVTVLFVVWGIKNE